LITPVLNLEGMLDRLAIYHFLEIEDLLFNLDLRRRARWDLRMSQECHNQQDK